ncbi:MAG: biotin--[acetyl-CoA-carboxylase] ligase [Candidatus Bathyarchaeia archaeon]
MKVYRLQESLKTKKFGKKIIFLREINSTNDFAKELASHGIEEGAVAVAEVQRAGRGRMGRQWSSPKGGLYFSIILRPKIKVSEAVKLVFVAGLAVAKVLEEIFRLKVEVKWPNDVLVSGKKVCGILVEMNSVGDHVNYLVVGIGVNANVNVEKQFPEHLRGTATSLEKELGEKIQLEELFKRLLEKLEIFYDLFLESGLAPILEEWKKYAFFLNHHVDVISEHEKFSGLAVDVNSDGALIVRLKNGEIKRVLVGDISVKIM